MEQVLEKYSVSDAKEKLSELLAGIETNGKPFVISRYGKPVAVVSSYNLENKVTPKLKGALNAYANQSLIAQEKQAWQKVLSLLKTIKHILLMKLTQHFQRNLVHKKFPLFL